MKLGEQVTATIVTRRHHFGVSCGRWGAPIYDVEGSKENGTLYGFSFSALGIEVGDGDRFEVTIKRLRRKKKTARFPKNAWLERRRV